MVHFNRNKMMEQVDTSVGIDGLIKHTTAMMDSTLTSSKYRDLFIIVYEKYESFVSNKYN